MYIGMIFFKNTFIEFSAKFANGQKPQDARFIQQYNLHEFEYINKTHLHK